MKRQKIKIKVKVKIKYLKWETGKTERVEK